MPLRLSPPLGTPSVRGLDCAFTFAVRRSGGSRPVSTPSPLGAWLGVASEGSAEFESIHARRFRRGVQQAHGQVPLESGVLPVTPRGNGCRPCSANAADPRDRKFYPVRRLPAMVRLPPRVRPRIGYAHGSLGAVVFSVGSKRSA